MTRTELEHVIRAAGAVTNQADIVVIGSQAILGAAPTADPALLVSMEADVFPADAPALAELIDGAIGEGSLFHDTFGYYAHGVGPETATLPAAWFDRVVIIDGPGTSGHRGLCLHPLDLCISKLAAGRDKDLAFTRTVIETKLISVSDLRACLRDSRIAEPAHARIAARIDKVAGTS